MSNIKNIVLLSIILLTHYACVPNYILEGKTTQAENGDMVTLYAQVNGEFVPIDSTTIIDGKFHFQGIKDSALMAVITVKSSEKKFVKPLFFVLQNEKIYIDMDSLYQVSGTELNDRFSALNKERMNYENQMNQLNKLYLSKYNAGNLTDSLYKQMLEHYELEKKQIEEITQDYVKGNTNNVTGIYVFIQNSFMFSPEEQRKIISSAPKEFQDNLFIKRMSKTLDLMKNVEIGMPYINLTMETPDGKIISLSDYIDKEKYILIDFWASWCPPCQKQISEFLNIYKLYHKKNFEIIGISFDTNIGAWKEFINTHQLPWPQMSDLQGWGSEAIFMYAIQGIPHTVLLSPHGKIIAKDLNTKDLNEKLKALLR